MENKSHAFAAGAFIITVVALLLGLATWLSRDQQEGDIYELSTAESVTGLSEQAAVRFRGINIGKVTQIGFDPLNKGQVLLRISIRKDVPLTESTYATLGYQGVTGLAFVQLDNEASTGAALTTNSDQPTRIPLRPGLLSQFADQGSFILEQTQRISERVGELLSPANQQAIMGSVQAIGETATKLGAASDRIQTILDAQLGPERTNIPALVADTRATMLALQKSTAELNATAQAATASAQALTDIAKAATAPNGLLQRLEQGAEDLSQSAQAINSVVLPSAVRAAEGAARTANAATSAARSVDRAATALADEPRSLIFGSGGTPPGPGEPGFVSP
ncbi:MlaD family protein [Hydrogenophaga sp.]|uniref:MlaD family protein n=1 Tax=Hydrogenophaga sp. TaxID=1904254 RepID=UPI0025C41C14|nr:MlaD family protein [Hydrogenophaga sp.]